MHLDLDSIMVACKEKEYPRLFYTLPYCTTDADCWLSLISEVWIWILVDKEKF